MLCSSERVDTSEEKIATVFRLNSKLGLDPPYVGFLFGQCFDPKE
jgi:hypothetical protein